MKRFLRLLLLALILLGGCAYSEGSLDKIESSTLLLSDPFLIDSTDSIDHITMDDAKERFAADGDYIILDVRRAEEFSSGHIPNAINIPNETIDNVPLSGLPDLDQLIYVYCRSGNRSKQAAIKLISIGYTNIIEFGGIIDWTGDIEY